MSDGRYEAEERQRLDDKYLHMCQVAENSARELMERDKMLYSSREKEKELRLSNKKLRLYIKEIAEIIYMQDKLENQDAWVQYMMTMGLYSPYNTWDDVSRIEERKEKNDAQI